jgi:aspartyl protease family protein
MLQDMLKIIGVAAIGVGAAAQFADRLPIHLLQERLAPATAAQPRTVATAQATLAQRPAAPRSASFSSGSAFDTVSIPMNPQRQYLYNVDVNGLTLPMVVDTGASFVSLRNEDAAAIGVYPSPGDYTLVMKTANGATHAAPVRLQRVQIGRIELYDVDAVVMEPGALHVSLLGMTFLSQLSRVEIAADELILRK